MPSLLDKNNLPTKATILNCANYVEGEPNVFNNKQDRVIKNNRTESMITDVMVRHQAALCHCL